MEKYYIVINKSVKNVSNKLEKEDTIKQSPKIQIIPDPSPKTMRRNKSRDNFMKYQWAWTL